ncbi:PREDICTED: DNA mismatch repair protein Mlh3-like [Dinoponera quadriceps]|uniref:DNA mismatch repair protein Mlh3-like n=1 Tax=Dinoponera quadriceps TaxID=609295 RepID=A0A6P3WR83_DINQU|nr:PREDICTED: DNA mismatch repair protein Mlh3-like [Dinoponera quadriceps]
MASNSELKLETLTKSNVTSFVQCVLELVANSLAAHAAAIAIRIHTEKREIQVIDNGNGIRQDTLESIGECNAKTMNNQQGTYDLSESNNRMLISIRHLSDSFTIASKYRNSMETFMKRIGIFLHVLFKVYKVGCAPTLTQIEQRPSHGTTVSIYGFHGMRENSDVKTICYFIAALAVAELKVSFSIRDEEQRRVALRIAKPHCPIDILRALFGKNLPLNRIWSIRCSAKYNTKYHGYIGLSEKNAMQCIFLNHRLISCSFILKLIIDDFKKCLDVSFRSKFNDKNIFILFFLTLKKHEFTFTTENGKKLLMFHDMQKILNSIKACAFKCTTEGITVCAEILHL